MLLSALFLFACAGGGGGSGSGTTIRIDVDVPPAREFVIIQPAERSVVFKLDQPECGTAGSYLPFYDRV